MSPRSLLVVIVGIPVVMALNSRRAVRSIGGGLSERHHAHHDTYTVPASLSRVFLIVTFFMALLALMLTWLCVTGAFVTNEWSLAAFFGSFQVVMALAWVGSRHYKVVTYEDYMTVAPFFGVTRFITYADITRLVARSTMLGGGALDIDVYVGDDRAAVLWCKLDVEQILLRVNRFDVLEGDKG